MFQVPKPKPTHILILGGLEAVQACAKKNNFSELEKLFFCKVSVFFKLLRKTMFQVPKPTHICILGGLEAVQACAKNKNRNLNNCFLQNPITSRKTI